MSSWCRACAYSSCCSGGSSSNGTERSTRASRNRSAPASHACRTHVAARSAHPPRSPGQRAAVACKAYGTQSHLLCLCSAPTERHAGSCSAGSHRDVPEPQRSAPPPRTPTHVSRPCSMAEGLRRGTPRAVGGACCASSSPHASRATAWKPSSGSAAPSSLLASAWFSASAPARHTRSVPKQIPTASQSAKLRSTQVHRKLGSGMGRAKGLFVSFIALPGSLARQQRQRQAHQHNCCVVHGRHVARPCACEGSMAQQGLCTLRQQKAIACPIHRLPV